MEIIIRKVKEKDIKDICELSNGDVVREHSIHTEKIKWEHHIVWFKERIEDKNHLFFIVSNKEEEVLGQVRFDIKEEDATISISLSRKLRGKGLSSTIVKNACEKAFNEKSELKRILAYIKPENIPSVKCFEKSGFKFSEKAVLNNKGFNLYIFKKIND